MTALLKWGCAGVYSLGMAFCLFSCLSIRRMAALGAFVLLTISLSRCARAKELVVRLGNWFASRPRTTLLILFALAVFARVCFALSLPGKGLWSIQGNDPRKFWMYAHEMASGAFPDVKSWTLTFLLSLSVRLFGDTLVPVVIMNIAFQFVTALALYLFAKKSFSTGAALWSATICLLSPSIIHINFCARPENCYFLFFSLALLALATWMQERKLLALLLLPLLTWLAVWTRGEAVLLLVLAPGCLAVDIAMSREGSRMRAICAFAFMCISCLAFAAAGHCINVRYHGTTTPLCSNDSWWPRLFGSNVASRGRVPLPKNSPKGVRLTSDKNLIYERYRKDHENEPGKGVIPRKPMYCPNELIPYIKEEIAHRWGALTAFEKVQFMVVKNWLPWNNPYAGHGQVLEKKLEKTVRYDIVTVLAVISCFFGLARWIRLSRNSHTGIDVVRVVPLLYLFGIVSIIAIAESNIRYGVIALLICPLYAFPPMPSSCAASRIAS